MAADDVVWRSAVECAALIRRKELSPVELTEAVLARIDAVNPRLNAFCLVAHDVARRLAREAEIAVMKGEPLGLLHGVPVSVKDVLFTRGMRTTGGSRFYADLIPEHDAVSVGRLKAAGAVLLGKTTTSEFGHKAVTESPLFGVTRNPWNLERTPGGSSGGAAAAVASGCGPIALGSDGGGSVRIPAAFCGLVGLKPSYGRVPLGVGFPGWDHVSHVGPLARSVRDAAAVLDVIAGGDDRDRESLPREPGSYVDACAGSIKGLNVAWTPDLGFARVEAEVLEVTGDAAAEFYAAWSDELPAAEERLDPTLVKFIRRGGSITARDYLRARARVAEYWEEVRAFSERFDLLLTPTTAVAPFAAGGKAPREIDGESVSVLGWMPFTYPFNLTGQPAVSVPAGLTADGLPVGLQIVGRRHADRAVLAAAAAYEAARPWSARRPAL